MKKNIAFLLFSFFLSFSSYSQNNLQFNQVITYNGRLKNLGNSGGDSTAAWTVPQGKVWKIESASASFGYATYPVFLTVNGTKVFDIYVYSSSSSRNVYFPVWLKGGDTAKIIEYYPSSEYFTDYFISILEFNVTQ